MILCKKLPEILALPSDITWERFEQWFWPPCNNQSLVYKKKKKRWRLIFSLQSIISKLAQINSLALLPNDLGSNLFYINVIWMYFTEKKKNPFPCIMV